MSCAIFLMNRLLQAGDPDKTRESVAFLSTALAKDPMWPALFILLHLVSYSKVCRNIINLKKMSFAYLREMKRYVLVMVAVLSSLAIEAQLDTALLAKNIYAAEDSMMALFKRKDWKTYADYMNPTVIELMGGKEQFVKTMQELKILDEVDVQIHKKGKILELEKMEKEYQCIVETFMQMQVAGVLASGSSYDIGTSTDGKTWTFFRIEESVTPDQIRQLLPNLNSNFKLPKAQRAMGKTLDEFMPTYVVQYLK
jgi:hypothetical protein